MGAIFSKGRRSRVPGRAVCRGCSGPAREWEAVCGTCWGRLPRDLRDALANARRARAPHLISDAARAAVTWLHDHTPGQIAAQRMGERG